MNKIFSSKKTYYIQSWIVNNTDYTYKITIQDDILATGKVDKTRTVEDYYTTVKKNNEIKLNINNYIGRQSINKENSSDDVTIKIESKDIFNEYEIYNFKINNKTGDDILMDSLEKQNTTYLKNDHDRIYNSYLYELTSSELKIEKGHEKSLKIKFNKRYSTDVRITKVVFEDIIKNYSKYTKIENKELYTDRIKISIEI